MAKPLTEAILKDLMIGVASIRMVPQVDTITDSTFDDADEIFTQEGTLNISQEEPTKTEIKIDQSDLAIGTIYTAGAFPITGVIPSSAKELFERFFDTSLNQPTLTTGITSIDGKTKYNQATGFHVYNLNKKVTMLIESQSKQSAIVFMNVDLVVTITWGDVKTTPLGITFSGSVIRNSTKGNADIVLLKSVPASI